MPSAVYTVTDRTGATDTATLRFADVPNRPPVANNDIIIKTNPNGITKGDVLANDRDPDGDPLRVTQFSIPGVGTFQAGETVRIPGVGKIVINADGTFTFTPNPGFSGAVPKIAYTVSDGTSTASAELRLSPVAGNGDGNIGAIILQANPTPSLYPNAATGAYSLPAFRELDPIWSSDKPANPSRLSLTRDEQQCDLYLKGSLRNQVVIERQYYNFSVPREAFCHCNINEELEFVATQIDGTPLPAWLHFNPKTLKFTGNPPKGAKNTHVLVTAKDQHGNTVHATFKVTVNRDNVKEAIKKDQPSAAIKISRDDSEGATPMAEVITGKAGFKEQLANTGKLTRLMESRALLDSIGQL